jgi:hypothetical protein
MEYPMSPIVGSFALLLRFGLVFTLAASLLLAACAGIEKSADFDRHRYSQLTTPRDRPGVSYFDLMFPAEYPADDPVADAARMRWLGTWLAQRGLCPEGFDVAKRRAFDYLEDNPRGYQQRWEVTCRAATKTE